MTGTDRQVEQAERYKVTAQEEFDRVANAFRVVAERQTGQAQVDTLAILAILEKKRTDVLKREDARYFTRFWREPGDQVRRLLSKDSRYQEIRAAQRARRERAVRAFVKHAAAP